ncbi:hypothetical protein SLEP1_g32988 [Rubroshorea leprosula]|uniref:Uncharacterized protein n=1 Tax=Rubroshorea leprosula TaxID=152421 RepID=A0AAV5KF59_9ROSI|nr:hypothetical protein SLEP1_g32988 [Rubroshorea leprosula]
MLALLWLHLEFILMLLNLLIDQLYVIFQIITYLLNPSEHSVKRKKNCDDAVFPVVDSSHGQKLRKESFDFFRDYATKSLVSSSITPTIQLLLHASTLSIGLILTYLSCARLGNPLEFFKP